MNYYHIPKLTGSLSSAKEPMFVSTLYIITQTPSERSSDQWSKRKQQQQKKPEQQTLQD